jgi:hypothetical protein
MKDGDDLFPRAVRQLASRVDLVGNQVLDAIGGQVPQLDLAQVRKHMVAEDRVIVAQRRWLALRSCAM